MGIAWVLVFLASFAFAGPLHLDWQVHEIIEAAQNPPPEVVRALQTEIFDANDVHEYLIQLTPGLRPESLARLAESLAHQLLLELGPDFSTLRQNPFWSDKLQVIAKDLAHLWKDGQIDSAIIQRVIRARFANQPVPCELLLRKYRATHTELYEFYAQKIDRNLERVKQAHHSVSQPPKAWWRLLKRPKN